MAECELCKLVAGNIITKLYYQDSDFIIVDCKTCGIPMVVWKYHGMDVTKQQVSYIKKLCYELFGRQITFREEQRKIKDHFHLHIEGIYAK